MYLDNGNAVITGNNNDNSRIIINDDYDNIRILDSIIWYIDNTKAQKIVEKLITRNSVQNPTSIVWHMYDFDGVTIVHTVTDTITYSPGVFEFSRTRTIS